MKKREIVFYIVVVSLLFLSGGLSAGTIEYYREDIAMKESK
jgi:hypothetical protein